MSYFQHQGKCAANTTAELDMDTPNELLNLDMQCHGSMACDKHRRVLLWRLDEKVPACVRARCAQARRAASRKGLTPDASSASAVFFSWLRWHKASTGKRVQAMSHGRFGLLPRDFYLKEAVERYNRYQPSRLFLDPYHVTDGSRTHVETCASYFRFGSVARWSPQGAVQSHSHGTFPLPTTPLALSWPHLGDERNCTEASLAVAKTLAPRQRVS